MTNSMHITHHDGIASIVRRYFACADACNAVPDDFPDDKYDVIARATLAAAAEELVGKPVRNAQDALAAVEWLVQHGRDNRIELDDSADAPPHDRICYSLLHALRDYLRSVAAQKTPRR
jgi:hypothetical protein